MEAQSQKRSHCNLSSRVCSFFVLPVPARSLTHSHVLQNDFTGPISALVVVSPLLAASHQSCYVVYIAGVDKKNGIIPLSTSMHPYLEVVLIVLQG